MTEWGEYGLVIGGTLVAYILALWLNKKVKGHVLANPLLITALMVVAGLYASGFRVQHYQVKSEVFTWLLGPATILLAVPLYQQLSQVRSQFKRLLLPVVAGGVAGPVMAYLILSLAAGLTPGVSLAMLTKSITTPLAMETAISIGGYHQLAAVFVCVTGVVGAVSASLLFRCIKVKSDVAQGLALGTACHAIGTARAVQISEKTAAYSSLALCLNGILTAIILPLLLWWFNR